MKECNACGKCCIKYGSGGLSVTLQELDLWQEDAPKLLEYVNEGQIWFHPTTKQALAVCPWLELADDTGRYHCAIYFNRPDDCRYYPSSIEEMIRDDCEMLEPKDKRNPKQAQKSLALIMKDSWV